MRWRFVRSTVALFTGAECYLDKPDWSYDRSREPSRWREHAEIERKLAAIVEERRMLDDCGARDE